MAIFFSAATAAGAFGGLLAYGIMRMDGIANLGGWAWIFILEGLATFIIGKFDCWPLKLRMSCSSPLLAVSAYWIMHDYPDTAKFLNEEEKREIVRRLEEDRSVLSNEFDLKFMWDAFKDWKIYVHMFITIGIYTPLYSISVFLPTIVRGLGYSQEIAQLMTVPPYIVACLFTVGGGWAADRHGQRGIYMIGFCLLAYVVLLLIYLSCC